MRRQQVQVPSSSPKDGTAEGNGILKPGEGGRLQDKSKKREYVPVPVLSCPVSVQPACSCAYVHVFDRSDTVHPTSFYLESVCLSTQRTPPVARDDEGSSWSRSQGLRSVPQAAKLKGNSTLLPVFRPPSPVPRLGIWSLELWIRLVPCNLHP
jgi:hypothetical protein